MQTSKELVGRPYINCMVGAIDYLSLPCQQLTEAVAVAVCFKLESTQIQ